MGCKPEHKGKEKYKHAVRVVLKKIIERMR